MIDEAERTGKSSPAEQSIEGTSGNTGMGLALVAVRAGYKGGFHHQRQTIARSKIDLLKRLARK